MEFSEFRISNMSVLFDKDTTSKKFGCVGSIEESFETKIISKKREGIVIKNRTKPTGAGELKISAHIDYDVYKEVFGMNDETLKEGIYGYGKNQHKTFCLTCDVFDEDDNKKLKAYPCCVVKEGIARKTTNGDEEVAEIEMTISLSADENGYPTYESLADELDETTTKTWHTKFTPQLVKKIA